MWNILTSDCVRAGQASCVLKVFLTTNKLFTKKVTKLKHWNGTRYQYRLKCDDTFPPFMSEPSGNCSVATAGVEASKKINWASQPASQHCLEQFILDPQYWKKPELGRCKRFRISASSHIRRKGILLTRWAKTRQCWKRHDRERRDGSQTRNFASLASVTLVKIVKPQKSIQNRML